MSRSRRGAGWWCPNCWCGVHICLKPKFPVCWGVGWGGGGGGRGIGAMPQLLMPSPKLPKTQIPYVRWGELKFLIRIFSPAETNNVKRNAPTTVQGVQYNCQVVHYQRHAPLSCRWNVFRDPPPSTPCQAYEIRNSIFRTPRGIQKQVHLISGNPIPLWWFTAF